MPRKKLIRSSEHAYHISVRCNNKEWFSIPLQKVWEIFSNHLYFIHKAYEAETIAFVLMSNHFHLILRTPHANLDEVMHTFLRESSRTIAKESQRINHVFGGPYHASLISDYGHYINAYKYVIRNPVHAGICKRVEQYPYSTLYGLLGQGHIIIPTDSNEELFSDTGKFIDWLNTAYPTNTQEIIQKALKRREFEIKRCRQTGKLIELTTF